jgi:hypothetical protein
MTSITGSSPLINMLDVAILVNETTNMLKLHTQTLEMSQFACRSVDYMKH